MISNHKNKRKHNMTDNYSITKTEQDFLSTMMTTEPELQETAPKKRSSFTIHRIPADDCYKAAKKVTFELDAIGSSSNNTSAPSSHQPLQLTDELCRELWYGNEITCMKEEAKKTVLHRATASPDALLGLEKFDCQRAAWKRSAIYYVLLAQKQHHGEEFIARVSKRCTGWARETAIRQGFKDYCAVHDPLASLFGCDKENYNDFFFSDKVCSSRSTSSSNSGNEDNTKRKAQDEESTARPVSPSSRNVRQRTAAA